MDVLSASDGGVQPAGFDEEPFNIRLHARFGYPLPRLAGGDDGDGAGGDGEDGSGDSFDAGEGQGSGLYDLSSAPEELRPYLEEQLRTVSKNVDARFREAADHRTKWSPYEELGVADVPTEELQELLAFRDLLGDEDGFKEWLKAASEQVGLEAGSPEMDQDAWFAYGEANGFFDGDGDPAAGEEQQPSDQDSLIEALMGRMQEQLGPINEFMAAQQQNQAVDGELQQANQTLEALREEHGEFDEAAVLKLAHAFLADPDVDPIKEAFAELQRIRGEGQSELFDEKSDQPSGSLSGGVVDTSPPKFNGLGDPALKDAARARFAASS